MRLYIYLQENVDVFFFIRGMFKIFLQNSYDNNTYIIRKNRIFYAHIYINISSISLTQWTLLVFLLNNM